MPWKFKLISFVCLLVCQACEYRCVVPWHTCGAKGQFSAVKFSPSTVGSRVKLRSLSLKDNYFCLLNCLNDSRKNVIFYHSF